MSKVKEFIGIDVSKDYIDVYDCKGEFHQFTNSLSGFKQLKKITNSLSHCIVEATGYYHIQLAYFLLEHDIAVSVENPLKVRRFI
ncbi:IS110 family transposase, partial [Joostella sp.]|uniref:IS110 family transposase n=1 Tax=Joostella sp. TaxID=2231138 RepID=UPI003A9557A1